MSDVNLIPFVRHFKANPHTVFMTIGPSTCGKTVFCKQHLIPNLPGSVRYLSSDDIRGEIIGSSKSKYDPEMTHVSHLAFEQLFSRASSYMSWPCVSEFIIIDTTGINEEFRKQVFNLCWDKNYSLVPILFDYKSYRDYFLYASDRSIVARHIKFFRERVLPNINRDLAHTKGSKLFIIKNRDFFNFKVDIPLWNSYLDCFIPSENKIIIIGNVNGCYEELMLLLKQFKNDEATIVLIGNPYHNDSPHNDKLRAFIENNNIRCVYEQGLPFVSTRYRWIATATLIEKKHLGKFYFKDGLSSKSDPVFNEPYRIFGTHPTFKMERKDNLCLIDGGCIHGGSLIGISFKADNKIFTKKQPALKCYLPGKLTLMFPHNVEIISSKKLPSHLKYRHHKIVRSAVPFLSGTMSPAPSDQKSGSFESLPQALLYYKQHGVHQVCLQPKYMGSRCTVILNNSSPSYGISRKGFSIRIPEFQKLLESLEKKYLVNGITTAIIDGELLPWVAMGQSLIDDTFRSVEVGLSKDASLLKKHGFENQLSKLTKAKADLEIPLNKANINKIGQGLYHTLTSYDTFISEWIGVDAMEQGLNIYSEQLALFTQETPIQFKPFALLKTIHTEDGKIIEHVYEESANTNFERVSDDIHTVVSVDDLKGADEFYKLVTEDNRMEGIVVKPDSKIESNVVPHIKVRNDRYLTLIYGPTYQEPRRLQALIKRKRVTDKQRISCLQHDIAQEILRLPIASLGSHNERYCNLVATFLKTNEEEEKMDPRL